jgi:murein tripeptide amidase MpaA
MRSRADRVTASAAIGAAALITVAAIADDLETVAERTRYVETGRFAEVERLCPAYAARWPDAVRCEEFGRTPEGRPLLALIASTSGTLEPQEARVRALPVLLVQGGIHAGEIDGKDAGFLALKEMLDGKVAPGALDEIVLVFVPVVNVDGHERFGRWNRPNQIGPEEMGWRTTAQNLNLNRDYTKADAPEMRAMLRLLNAWDPILYVDLHVTDGAQFEHDISNTIEPHETGDPAMQEISAALLLETNDRLEAQGALPLDFYPSLRDESDPALGFVREPNLARFSTGYWALRNRLALLVETHSWKDYATRVRLTHDTIVAVAELTARDGAAWLGIARRADEEATRLGGVTVPLSYTLTDTHQMIDFKGYAYTREPSAVSGTFALRFDPQTPRIWHVPLYDDMRPADEVTLPKGGYVVPAAHAESISGRLDAHGIVYRRLDGDEREVEVFRADKVERAAATFEGRTRLTLAGNWTAERRSVAAGSLFVPIAQAKARLVIALFEPRAPDSFAAWGFFNAHFEAKEYMEDYVAEEVAREMLATSPEVAAEFNERLATDLEFAQDPNARLEFFYRRHPSWDEWLDLYPVLRVAEDLQ